MARVNVVMACKNAESTIGSAVRAVVEQSFKDFTLTVVDDASTDGSVEVVQTVAGRDKRVQIVHLTNGVGSGAARNIGAASSDSEYIAVADADDLSRRLRLERQITAFSRNSKLSVVSGQLAEFGSWGGPVLATWPVDKSRIERRKAELKMPVPHPASMFRAVEFTRVGGYDEACLRAQDYALMLKLRGTEMMCLPEATVFYRTVNPIPFEYVVKDDTFRELAKKNSLGRSYEPVGSVVRQARVAAHFALRRRADRVRRRGLVDVALRAELAGMVRG